MNESPFIDFRTYNLVFTNKAGGTVTTDSRGNPKPGEGVPVALECTLKASTDPKVLRLAGADTSVVALSGRCVEPMRLPDGIRPGMTSPLTVNGVKGVFTIGPSWPSMLLEVEEALGQRIVGTWKVN